MASVPTLDYSKVEATGVNRDAFIHYLAMAPDSAAAKGDERVAGI